MDSLRSTPGRCDGGVYHSRMALIGDQDRDRAVESLGRHYARGRLSIEELAERVEVALAARRDSDVRVALTDLPSGWREGPGGVRSGLEDAWRGVRRTAFVIAVWLLWWVASLVLLIGFVVTAIVQGVSLANVAVFAALWLVCTLGARNITRRGRHARS
jgi:Domain of unknown function (DUF1707)